MSAVLSVVENDLSAANGEETSGVQADAPQGAIIETRYIPVSQLVASPRNVRAKSADKGDVPGLAAMILAQDLLQALSVVEVKAKGKSKKPPVYEVDAGERRRCALNLLVEQGKISPDFEVLCNIIDPSRGREVSLAENTRQAMHPADEMQAFADLIAEGKTEAQIATIFGCRPLTVKRRLALIAAAPELIEEFRKDNITQEQLQALILNPDHTKQLEVWRSAGHEWDRKPAALQRAMTEEEVSTLTDPVAAFVGVEAFEAAGGIVRRDLFTEEAGHGYIQDKALLDKLAIGLLEPTCEALRAEGWAWVEARTLCTQDDLRGSFVVSRKAYRTATPQEQSELDRIDARQKKVRDDMDALNDADDYDEDKYSELDEEDDKLTEEREGLVQTMQVWGEEVKAHGGCIVTIKKGDVPSIQIHGGLVRREDFAKMQAAIVADGSGDKNNGFEFAGQAQSKQPKAEFSEGLTKRLTAHKTAALRVMVANNVQVALATLAHNLVQNVFGRTSYGVRRSAMKITATSSQFAVRDSAEDMQESKAWTEMEAIIGAWERRLPQDQTALMGWLLGLPILELQALIAVCSAMTIDCIQARPAAHDGDLLARAVGLDMNDWWQATPESYFNHVSKAKMKLAVAEAMSEGAAETLEKLKKAEAAAEATKLVEERGWLPSVLRTPEFVLVGQTQAHGESDAEGGDLDMEDEDQEQQ